jgi:hypothetical protein
MKKPVASYLAELSGLDLENLGRVSLLQKQERQDLNHSIGYGDYPKDPAPVQMLGEVTSSLRVVSMKPLLRVEMLYLWAQQQVPRMGQGCRWRSQFLVPLFSNSRSARRLQAKFNWLVEVNFE